jgi:outer membrane protein assembly factor BamB
LAAGGAMLMVAAGPPARAGTDWTTFGFDAQRTGYNPAETALGVGNVGKLRQLWATDVGGLVLTQPTVATGVATAGGPRDLVYVGLLTGNFLALDRATGAVVWQKAIPSISTSCEDFPPGGVGIVGTPTLDRSRHAIYLAAANGQLHALDEATGAELPGWPVSVVTDGAVDVVYGSPTLAGGSLYVETAGLCDDGPYHGRVVRVDAATPRVTGRWFTVVAKGKPFGGGVWGPGGVSADSGSIYAATGNSIGQPENAGDAEAVVRLSPDLKPLAADKPSLTGEDLDFGATPLLYRAKGCPAQLAAMNKSGALFVYDRGKIGKGSRQRIQMADIGRGELGEFIGEPAYDPVDRLLLVKNPSPSSEGTYQSGLVALKVQDDCTLAPAWQRPFAFKPGGRVRSIPPVVANGVVYGARERPPGIEAVAAVTGARLWGSGKWLRSAVLASPTVVDGRLFVAASDGKLHAFGL